MNIITKTNTNTRTADSGTRRHVLVALTVLLLSILLVRRDAFFDLNIVPGDPGDARFNIYVLEHTLLYLKGLHASYLSPPIFYPYASTLLFSDTHVGSALAYCLFRMLGLTEYQAFTLWMLTGYAVTFIAANYAMMRLAFPPLIGAVASAMFTFSLPALAQIGHAQMACRPGVPLGFLFLYFAMRDKSIPALFWAVFWVALQVLIGIYSGLMLIILLTVFAVAYQWYEGGLWNTARGRFAWQEYGANLKQSGGSVVAVLMAGASVLGMLALLAGYARVSSKYGLSRSWDEVVSMLPRPASYITADFLPYWGSLRLSSQYLPMRHEHQLFVGLGTLIPFGIGVVALWKNKVEPGLRPLMATMLVTVIAILLLVTAAKGFTLYRMIYVLPGFGALRSVTRMMLLVMFPISVIAAVGLQAASRTVRFNRLGPVVAVLSGLLFAFEIGTIYLYRFSGSEQAALVDNIVSAAKASAAGRPDPVLHYVGGASKRDPWYEEVDAMLASIKLGWPTVNGYSGFTPVGYASQDCALRTIVAFERKTDPSNIFVDLNANPDTLASRVVQVGQLAPLCNARLPGGSSAASSVQLIDRGVKVLGEHIGITVGIVNRSAKILTGESPSRGTVGYVRLSWRFLPDGIESQDFGWSTRYSLPYDIRPNDESSVVTIMAPRPRGGRFTIQVSMVSEAQFWFHNHGMQVLTMKDVLQGQ